MNDNQPCPGLTQWGSHSCPAGSDLQLMPPTLPAPKGGCCYCSDSAPIPTSVPHWLLIKSGCRWLWLVDKERLVCLPFSTSSVEGGFCLLWKGFRSWETNRMTGVSPVSLPSLSVRARLLVRVLGKNVLSFVRPRRFICLLFKTLLIGKMWSWQPIICPQMFWKLSSPWNPKDWEPRV